jgi:hypothetical protein
MQVEGWPDAHLSLSDVGSAPAGPGARQRSQIRKIQFADGFSTWSIAMTSTSVRRPCMSRPS